eukprot:1159263-Pelagomonas_calceolata.AAC.3
MGHTRFLKVAKRACVPLDISFCSTGLRLLLLKLDLESCQTRTMCAFAASFAALVCAPNTYDPFLDKSHGIPGQVSWHDPFLDKSHGMTLIAMRQDFSTSNPKMSGTPPTLYV